MSDPYLDLFVTTHESSEGIDSGMRVVRHAVTFTLKDKIEGEVIIPLEVAEGADPKQVGLLVADRMMMDLSEGVLTALNKTNPDMFPSQAEFEAYKEGTLADKAG
jgi:hypothetical protein